jgi:ornithine carbamoyltransferase
MAEAATIPVINGLSDFSHPCQALADIFTIEEKLKNLKGKLLAYVGDGNNVCNSLLLACAKLGINMAVAAPSGYEPDKEVLATAMKIAKSQGGWVSLCNDPTLVARNADVLYTDVWASMGQEKEIEKRKKIFQKFQINKKLVELGKRTVLVMHCLPAHRGQEITDEVLDSKNSVVYDQAENRMHVQQAILIKLLVKGSKRGLK